MRSNDSPCEGVVCMQVWRAGMYVGMEGWYVCRYGGLVCMQIWRGGMYAGIGKSIHPSNFSATVS